MEVATLRYFRIHWVELEHGEVVRSVHERVALPTTNSWTALKTSIETRYGLASDAYDIVSIMPGDER